MLELTDTQHVLFNLLRCSLGKSYEPLPTDIDCAELFDEAKKQAVPLLVASALEELAVDDNVKKQAEVLKLQSIRPNLASVYAVEQMDLLMRSCDFRYIILKGCSAAHYYPEPMNRMLGDVDFLIDPSQRKAVESMFKENNYDRADSEDHHISFNKPNQHLEMHFKINGIPGGDKEELVNNYMENAVFEPVEFEFGGRNIKMPKPKYHGLILLLHMQYHMRGVGLGLRHLMDLAVFVDRTYEDSFWEADLIPLLKEIGLYKYAQVMIKTGAVYFGMLCPQWASEADDSLCDDVMNDILSGGNFGRKNIARSYASRMISEDVEKENWHGKLHGLYTTLHYSSLLYWPKLKRHKVIWFFADCFRALKFILFVIIGKKPSIFESNMYVEERKNVYDRLEVFKVK